MNISIKWLSEYLSGEPININKKDIKDYCDKMTYSGSKVENFEILFSELKNIVVGKLLSVEKHPDADKLFVCQVEVGRDALGAPLVVQIVTGAKNVKAGDIVPVAMNNSVVHGGKKITKGKLRGVESNGMLCSLEELGLNIHDFPYAEEDGILVLQGDDLQNITIGQDIKSALLMDDAAVEFEITPNRADCFSVIGLARESAVTLDRELKLHAPEIERQDKSDDIKNYLTVEVKNYDLCPRYTAKVIKDVKIEPSPLWLRAKLRASGIRPINNIVDITNYVMLEYGQPMHAFDYNYLGGKKIIVRTAEKDEKITTLDSVVRELNTDMLVIADGISDGVGGKPVALAGIMGGENSEILDTTKTIVFESANFDKMSVRRTSRKLGLRTDSSANFEKGLDLYLTVPAITRACELVEMLNCGTVVSGVIDVLGEHITSKKIKLDVERINNLLGSSISKKEMIDILEKLDFKYAGDGVLDVPSYRYSDLSGDTMPEITADLAEEIGRIYGLNNIKNAGRDDPGAPLAEQIDGELRRANKFATGELGSRPTHSYSVRRGGRDKFQKFLLNLHNTLTSNGYYETYTFSFITPKYFDKLNLPENSPLRDVITLINPLGEDTSVMRTTLLPSTLATIARNYANRNEYGYFYDTAKVYFKYFYDGLDETKLNYISVRGQLPANEKNMLSLGFYDTADKSADFYTIKGAVENIMKAAGIYNYKLSADISGHTLASAFHPGRSAVILSDDEKNIYGIFGEIHPSVAESFEIGTRCCAAELNIDLLYANSTTERSYIPFPKYPAITRDLALVCDDNLESAVIYDIIKGQSGKIFESAKPFDVYKGEKIGAGKKSIAFGITFRNSERTLSDDEVNLVIDKILKNLEKFNILLRK
ncbi:MAG: phenylalanine--tRNA ligase subunit beta [Oscillospiraceae bacterium]|nr:phenylalanine--tRNA ligase subunit beta [Oscillospiraceae bacterium]